MVLDGYRILDFGRYVAGPYCAALLADLGAQVIRIERPGGNEDRFVCPVTSHGEGSLFLHCNRNKLGITLNPDLPKGRVIVRQLVGTADIVVANMPLTSLRSLGLDYETLRSIKSDIILAMQTGFGSSGPYADRTGFDGVAQAMSGATYLSGLPASPVKSYATWTDFGTAMLSAFGVLAAVLEREKTGHGQCVETDLLRSALAMFQHNNIEEYFTALGRQGTANRSQQAGPADLFRTRDGAIHMQVVGHGLFKRWCRLVGQEDWIDDPRFANDTSRAAEGETLSARTQAWCETRTSDEALAALADARIPAGPLLSPRATLTDPHIATMITDMEYHGLPGPVPMLNAAVQMSGTATGINRSAPTLGEHTDTILGELGYSAGEIQTLRREMVV